LFLAIAEAAIKLIDIKHMIAAIIVIVLSPLQVP
jgi:hypothetical protein